MRPVEFAKTNGPTDRADKVMGKEIMENHDYPFLWMVSQFTHHVFRLNEETLKNLTDFQTSLKIRKEDLQGRKLFG